MTFGTRTCFPFGTDSTAWGLHRWTSFGKEDVSRWQIVTGPEETPEVQRYYPGDVLGGALLGMLGGWLLYGGYGWLEKWLAAGTQEA